MYCIIFDKKNERRGASNHIVAEVNMMMCRFLQTQRLVEVSLQLFLGGQRFLTDPKEQSS